VPFTLATTGHVHHTVPRLSTTFKTITTQGQESVFAAKWAALQTMLHEWQTSQTPGTVLLFVNTRASARQLHQALLACYVDVHWLHSQQPFAERERQLALLNTFSATWRWVVCTGTKARGLDLHQVRAVVNFDFPNDVVDYLHRVGRTARANQPGHAINFVTPQNAFLATQIQALQHSQHALEPLFSRKRSLRKQRSRCGVE